MSNQDIRIRPATTTDRPTILDIFATGMADNPLHVAAYGRSVERRVRAHRRLVAAGLEVIDAVDLICLEEGSRVVAAAGIGRPGACRPTTRQRLALMPTLATLGPVVGGRVMRWLGTWVGHDPSAIHSHIGPVAVRKESQGRGLGTALLQAVVGRLDAAGVAGYLETDRGQNVRFYQRQGFAVVAQADVLGVPNWFMWRDASAH